MSRETHCARARNEVSGRIPQCKRRGEPVQELIEEMRGVGQRIKQLDADRTALDRRIQEFLEQLPNVPDADVAGGGKESNTVLHVWGERTPFDFVPRDHIAIATDLGMIDFERGVKIAGNGFWVYRGAGALLELALINYCIGRNVAAGYELMLLPHIVNWECGYVSRPVPEVRPGRVPAGRRRRRPARGGRSRRPRADSHGGDRPSRPCIRTRSSTPPPCPASTAPLPPAIAARRGSYRTHDRGTHSRPSVS